MVSQLSGVPSSSIAVMARNSSSRVAIRRSTIFSHPFISRRGFSTCGTGLWLCCRALSAASSARKASGGAFQTARDSVQPYHSPWPTSIPPTPPRGSIYINIFSNEKGKNLPVPKEFQRRFSTSGKSLQSFKSYEKCWHTRRVKQACFMRFLYRIIKIPCFTEGFMFESK